MFGIRIKHSSLDFTEGFEYLGNAGDGFTFGYNKDEASIFLDVEEAIAALESRAERLGLLFNTTDFVFLSTREP